MTEKEIREAIKTIKQMRKEWSPEYEEYIKKLTKEFTLEELERILN